MKRKLAYILVVTLMAGVLWACDKGSKEEPTPTVENKEPTVVEEPAQEVSDENPEFAYTSVKYDDDYEYFSGSIQCVELTDSGHQALSEAVNAYFSGQVKQFNSTCENMVQEAKKTNDKLAQDKTDNEGAENEFVYDYTAYYLYDVSVEVTRCDNQMFSIHMTEYTYEGGANGVQNEYGITFDTQTGEILENTSFEASASAIAEAIREDIDNSSDEVKAQLDSDYDDIIARMEEGALSTVGVWFNERGIVIAFPQNSMGPHSLGTITFNVPYYKLTGFDEKYIISQEDFFTATISSEGFADMIDVHGDGNEVAVYIEAKENEEGTSDITLHVGEEEIKLNDTESFYVVPMFVHCSTGNYFMLTATGYNDWNTIYMYNADKNYVLVQSMDGSIESISDGKAVIDNRVYAFGTWTASKEYTYDGNGFSTTETVDNFNNNPLTNGNAQGITLLKDMEYTDASGETQELDKGTVIYPLSQEDNTISFTTEDGSIKGTFEYTYTDGERFVDGVSEYELFDGMPYAG